MAQAPKIRSVPITSDPSISGILSDLKAAVEHLTVNTQVPPQPPTGFTVTPIAGGNVVQFSRSNATSFRVYASSSPSRTNSTIMDLGSNNEWTHSLGQGGVLQYYWVEAISYGSNLPSKLVGPVSGTTLALGVAAPVAPPKQPSYGTVYDTTTGSRRPIIPGNDFVTPGKQAQ